MSERDTYPPGVPCWVTAIQPNPEAAADFYGELFGWDYEDRGGFFVARLRGKDVAAVAPLPRDVDPPPPADWITDICVDSADDVAARARSAGGSVLAEPFDGPAGRVTVIADPAGAVFGASERRLHEGAQLVNEPGAWSMSSLNTRDAGRASEFYGDLFDWTAESLDLGGAEISLFRLEGFVGGEPEQPVPRDVVATMAPIGDEAPADMPANWSVDFWVDDVDAALERVTEAGGSVTAPAFEIPDTPLKQAVVADPRGATFSITEVTVPS
jgi:predicted enzyme related to lactoylglutathione lyase